MRPVKAFLFHRVNDKGLAPVKLYLRLAGKTVRPNVGVYVAPEDWDEENGLMRGRSQQAKRTNLVIARKIAAANEILTEFELRGVELTPKMFMREFRNPGSRADFLQFFETNMTRNFERRVIAPATHKQEQMTLDRLKRFSGGKVLFSDISRAWLEEFDQWHAEQLRGKGFSGFRQREKSLKHIKKYLHAAKDTDDQTYRFTWPFQGFKWPKYTKLPVFLSEEEVARLVELYDRRWEILDGLTKRGRALGMDDSHLEQYANEEGVERVRRCIRWFLFQCFTGVRYSDLQALTWDNIQGSHLVFVPVKTKNSSGAEVRQILTAAARRFIPEPRLGRHFRRTGALHPDLVSNQKYNDRLKEMAEIAGISKRVTTHVGRHTFATYCLRKGVSLPVLQELLGVASVKTLMVYVHVVQEQKDEELMKVFTI